jgi:hypothetical protein
MVHQVRMTSMTPVLRIAGLRLLHHYSHSSDLADLAAPPLV